MYKKILQIGLASTKIESIYWFAKVRYKFHTFLWTHCNAELHPFLLEISTLTFSFGLTRLSFQLYPTNCILHGGFVFFFVGMTCIMIESDI